MHHRLPRVFYLGCLTGVETLLRMVRLLAFGRQQTRRGSTIIKIAGTVLVLGSKNKNLCGGYLTARFLARAKLVCRESGSSLLLKQW